MSEKPSFSFTRVISPTPPSAAPSPVATVVPPAKNSPSLSKSNTPIPIERFPSAAAQPATTTSTTTLTMTTTAAATSVPSSTSPTTSTSTSIADAPTSTASSASTPPSYAKGVPQFQNKTLEASSEEVELKVGDLTITHPSLSSALTSAAAFDKLYKSVAFKSNSAFTSVNRSRSSVRMKNALGNLAFARGHYQEALKYFDESLINVYVSEGWDRLLFTLYNKIAECYARLNCTSEYCSTLLCLLFPRLRSFATIEQRAAYQREMVRLAAILEVGLPISIDANSKIDKMINVRVSILSPSDKTPLTSIKAISSINFAMGDIITIKANVTSEFPIPIVAEKFYLTFHTTNPKTQRTRTFHVGTSNLTLVPGLQVVTLNAQLTKGRWGLASYSMSFGKITIATRYFHPIPSESSAYLQLVVSKSATNTTLKVEPPQGCLVLGSQQYLEFTIDSNQDSIKEAMIALSFDGATIDIPDGALKATLTTSARSLAPAPSNGTTSSLPSSSSSKETTASATSTSSSNSAVSTPAQPSSDCDALVTIDCEVLVRNRVVAIPELSKNSKLRFFLPTIGHVVSERDDGQLAPLSRELLLDLSFRKSSNEKISINLIVPLKYFPPLLFEHTIVPSETSVGAHQSSPSPFFVTTTVKNQSLVPINITSHTSTAEGSIVVTQDYNAALGVDAVTLQPGDHTSLLMAVVDPSRMLSKALISSSLLSTGSANSRNSNNWIVIAVNAEVTTNTGGPNTSSRTSYWYNIPFRAVTPLYKVNMRFAGVIVVGEHSELNIDFYLPLSDKTTSPSFAAFYRLVFDPSQWVVSGRTYGKLKTGTTEISIRLVALSATSVPPSIQIEETSSAQDAHSKPIVPPEDISIKHAQSTLQVRPQARIICVCRELVES